MAAKYAYIKAKGMQRPALIQIHHLRAILHWFQIKDDRDLVKVQLEDRTKQGWVGLRNDLFSNDLPYPIERVVAR